MSRLARSDASSCCTVRPTDGGDVCPLSGYSEPPSSLLGDDQFLSAQFRSRGARRLIASRDNSQSLSRRGTEKKRDCLALSNHLADCAAHGKIDTEFASVQIIGPGELDRPRPEDIKQLPKYVLLLLPVPRTAAAIMERDKIRQLSCIHRFCKERRVM